MLLDRIKPDITGCAKVGQQDMPGLTTLMVQIRLGAQGMSCCQSKRLKDRGSPMASRCFPSMMASRFRLICVSPGGSPVTILSTHLRSIEQQVRAWTALRITKTRPFRVRLTAREAPEFFTPR